METITAKDGAVFLALIGTGAARFVFDQSWQRSFMAGVAIAGLFYVISESWKTSAESSN